MKKILLFFFVLALNTYISSQVSFSYFYDGINHDTSYHNSYHNSYDMNYDYSYPDRNYSNISYSDNNYYQDYNYGYDNGYNDNYNSYNTPYDYNTNSYNNDYYYPYYNNTYSNSYNTPYDYNYNSYNNYTNLSNNGCESGKIGSYSYPSLKNKNTYTTSVGYTTVTLVCDNGYVSIRNTAPNNPYNYTRNTSTNYSNDYTNYSNNSCSSGRIGAYTHPELSNGSTYTTTVGDTTITLICNNGYMSVKSSNTTYYNNPTPPSDNSCKASSIGSYSYPNLNNNETYDYRKSITGGSLVTILKCQNGYVSLTDSYATCYNDYIPSGNSCIKSHRDRHNRYYYN